MTTVDHYMKIGELNCKLVGRRFQVERIEDVGRKETGSGVIDHIYPQDDGNVSVFLRENDLTYWSLCIEELETLVREGFVMNFDSHWPHRYSLVDDKNIWERLTADIEKAFVGKNFKRKCRQLDGEDEILTEFRVDRVEINRNGLVTLIGDSDCSKEFCVTLSVAISLADDGSLRDESLAFLKGISCYFILED